MACGGEDAEKRNGEERGLVEDRQDVQRDNVEQ